MRITCKEASRLLSLGLDHELTFGQRTALRLHLALCNACTNVKATTHPSTSRRNME